MGEEQLLDKQPKGPMHGEAISEEQDIARERLEPAPPVEEHVLHRPLQDLLELHPDVTVDRHTPLRAAIERMQEAHLDGVIVVEQGKVVGVLNAFDICEAMLGDGLQIDQTPVEALMHPNPECLQPDNDVAFALHKMHVLQYPLIPLVDDQGVGLGVISCLDVIGALAEMYPQEVLNLPPSPADESPPKAEGA